MIGKKFIDKLRNWSLDYAQRLLEEKSFDNCLRIHSIYIIGGIARCYFDPKDKIKNHKDIDIDIIFSTKVRNNVDGKTRMKINTQGRPRKKKFNGKPIDISRNVLSQSASENRIKDIKEYAQMHKTPKWWGSKNRKGRVGNSIIVIYPTIKPIREFKTYNGGRHLFSYCILSLLEKRKKRVKEDQKIISSFLDATYSVYFRDSIMGFVAFHNFSEMIKKKYGKTEVDFVISDEKMQFKSKALLEVMRCSQFVKK